MKPITPNISRTKAEALNRALVVRRDGDNFKVPSITIYDIDYAIRYQLKEVISPYVLENNKRINVPVIHSDGEKWAQVMRYGYMRDGSDRIQSPVIVLKRSGMEEDTRVPKLDVNEWRSSNMIRYIPRRQRNNRYNNLYKTLNTKKSYEYYLGVIPEFYVITYELYLWTDRVYQMNHLIEQIIPDSKKAWGDVRKFVTFINSFDFNTESEMESSRVVRASTTLTTYGIILNEFEGSESTIRKAHSIKRVAFDTEREERDVSVDHFPDEIHPSDSYRQMSDRGKLINSSNESDK